LFFIARLTRMADRHTGITKILFFFFLIGTDGKNED